MSLEIKVLCDGCGNDLNTPTGYADYRLTLASERRPTGSTVFAMYIYPPLDQDKHFCGVGCLKEWINKDA